MGGEREREREGLGSVSVLGGRMGRKDEFNLRKVGQCLIGFVQAHPSE